MAMQLLGCGKYVERILCVTELLKKNFPQVVYKFVENNALLFYKNPRTS